MTLGCVINVAVVLKLMFSIKPLHANLFLQAMQRNAKTSQPLLIGSSSFLFWRYYTMIFVVLLWTYLVFTTENSISNHFPIFHYSAYIHICYIYSHKNTCILISVYIYVRVTFCNGQCSICEKHKIFMKHPVDSSKAILDK